MGKKNEMLLIMMFPFVFTLDSKLSTIINTVQSERSTQSLLFFLFFEGILQFKVNLEFFGVNVIVDG